jgi:hypothetical protein
MLAIEAPLPPISAARRPQPLDGPGTHSTQGRRWNQTMYKVLAATARFDSHRFRGTRRAKLLTGTDRK